MDKRGIMRHGRFKTFLTRGIFRNTFKPLLYKNEDYVDFDFREVFLPLAKRLNTEDNQMFFLAYWLITVPKDLFEILFIAGGNGKYYLNAVKDSDLKNGNLCGHYTQAFVLWHLEQILKNNDEFRNKVGITMEDIDYILNNIYGSKNLTTQYLNELRTQFDLEKMEVDPRDWGIIYVYNIYDLLINNEQIKNKSISEWDRNILEKIEFLDFIVRFFNDKKEDTLAVLNR